MPRCLLLCDSNSPKNLVVVIMQLSSLFTLLFTLFALGLTVAAAPIPATPLEERSFNLSGRVVDKRVGRALKHFKINRPTRVVAARNGYDDNNNDNNNGNSYGNGNGNDQPHNVVGGYGGGGAGGPGQSKDNSYGGNNNNNNSNGGNNNGYGGDNNGHGGVGGGYGGDNSGHGGVGGGYGGDNNGHGGAGGGYGSGSGDNSPKPPKPSR